MLLSSKWPFSLLRQISSIVLWKFPVLMRNWSTFLSKRTKKSKSWKLITVSKMEHRRGWNLAKIPLFCWENQLKNLLSLFLHKNKMKITLFYLVLIVISKDHPQNTRCSLCPMYLILNFHHKWLKDAICSSKFQKLFIPTSTLAVYKAQKRRKFPSINHWILPKHISEWTVAKMSFLKASFVQDPNKKAQTTQIIWLKGSYSMFLVKKVTTKERKNWISL